jgi:hypothetical protein
MMNDFGVDVASKPIGSAVDPGFFIDVNDSEYTIPGELHSGRIRVNSQERRLCSIESRLRHLEQTVQRLITVLEVRLGVVDGVSVDDCIEQQGGLS